MENCKQKIELADILQDHIVELESQQNFKLCKEQLKAVHSIVQCRTHLMGGYINQCDHCGQEQQAYRSCRNRHCPKCQYTKQLQWVEQIKSNLPQTRYSHIVFTVPESLKALFYINQRLCYSMLFKAASESLKEVGLMPNLLGAETGSVSILHTWGQSLVYHPHIHMIVPSGGLSVDGMEWISSAKDFFLPVKVLGKVFRRKFCENLERQWDSKIKVPEKWKHQDYLHLKNRLYEKNWNVNAEEVRGGVKTVINYLGNYIHRIAISNHRIVDYDGSFVWFRYKDHKTGVSNRIMKLPVMELIRRFLQHVLPKGFYKIRYYGILASVNAPHKRECIYDLLDQEQPLSKLKGLDAYDTYRTITGDDPSICRKCRKGKMKITLKNKKPEG